MSNAIYFTFLVTDRGVEVIAVCQKCGDPTDLGLKVAGVASGVCLTCGSHLEWRDEEEGA